MLEPVERRREVDELAVAAPGRRRSGAARTDAASRPVASAAASATSSTVAERGRPQRRGDAADRADAQLVERVQPRAALRA